VVAGCGRAQQAGEYFDQAVRLAEGELQTMLQERASHFHRDMVVRFNGPAYSPLVTYPWIDSLSSEASTNALTAQVRTKAQRSKSVTIGGGGAAGRREIDAALLQAEWAGAFWLLPKLFRAKASIELIDAPSDGDLAEALSLWALGGGENPAQLIDAFESSFTHETAECIVRTLHSGARLSHQSRWLPVAGALWDEVSDETASRWIVELPLRKEFAHEYPAGESAEALSLYAVLSVRDPATWIARFDQLPGALQALALRSMAPSVADRLPIRVLQRALAQVFSIRDIDEAWLDSGWDTVARTVQRIGSKKWKSALREQIPGSAVPSVGAAYPGLLPVELLEACLDTLVHQLELAQADWERGSDSMYVRDPAASAVLAAIAIGARTPKLIDQLITQSIAKNSSSQQAEAALRGLKDLFIAGLASGDDVKPALQERSVRGPDFWDGKANDRLESVRRSVIAMWTADAPRDPLLAASKDPSARVRRVAVDSCLELASRQGDEVSDAILFGALYDPDDSVQMLGVRALGRSVLGSEVWTQIGWARVGELWGEANRSVRSAIVFEISTAHVSNDRVRDLLKRAQSDRSVSVRIAAKDAQRRLQRPPMA